MANRSWLRQYSQQSSARWATLRRNVRLTRPLLMPLRRDTKVFHELIQRLVPQTRQL
jgi:hypothetical protein